MHMHIMCQIFANQHTSRRLFSNKNKISTLFSFNLPDDYFLPLYMWFNLYQLNFVCELFLEMAHFNLENEFNRALNMDGPISKGPAMRWQRKLNDSSANSSNLKNSNGSLLQSINSVNSNKSPARIPRSLSLSSLQSNQSNISTPSRGSRTPGRPYTCPLAPVRCFTGSL